jgi:hypothetical protein
LVQQLKLAGALAALLATLVVAGCQQNDWAEGEEADHTSMDDAMADRGMSPQQQENLREQANPDAR